MPPDRVLGYESSNPFKPTSSINPSAVSLRSFLGTLFILRPNSTFSPYRLPGEQGVLLKNHAALGMDAPHGFPFQKDFSVRGPFEARHQVEKGGLSASGGTHHNHKFPRMNRQVHAPKRFHFTPIRSKNHG